VFSSFYSASCIYNSSYCLFRSLSKSVFAFSIAAMSYSYLYFSCLSEDSTLLFSSSISTFKFSYLFLHCSISAFLTKTTSLSYSSGVNSRLKSCKSSLVGEVLAVTLEEIGGSGVGKGSLERSERVITKMVPSAPPDIKYLPSGESRTLVTSPMWRFSLLMGTPMYWA
jgi:hypothetical protein